LKMSPYLLLTFPEESVKIQVQVEVAVHKLLCHYSFSALVNTCKSASRSFFLLFSVNLCMIILNWI